MQFLKPSEAESDSTSPTSSSGRTGADRTNERTVSTGRTGTDKANKATGRTGSTGRTESAGR